MCAEENLKEVRSDKVRQMREAGECPYPNDFRRTARTGDLSLKYGDAAADLLELLDERFSLAGRIVSMRDFGKSCFAHVLDESGILQLYFQKDVLSEGRYGWFKKWVDIGDIVGVGGSLFRTRTGELTLKVETFRMLSKALRTLPEKFHGLKDVELRYRKRYLDMIANPSVQEVFRKRARIVRLVRKFFDDRGFLEVETPMMHPLAGGAAARPFSTFHNALDQTLYLRIAPELYLKRLLVGGVGKVYEVNKNFRNEGLSSRHNPEFTMIEFYEAFAAYQDFMLLTEELICGILMELHGRLQTFFQGMELDFSPPWKRLSLEASLVEVGGISPGELEDVARLRELCTRAGVDKAGEKSRGELVVDLFEDRVEEKLVQPTFITHYPVDVSPLARSCEDRPGYVDRFELIIAGREVANGFSELNDPQEQRKRFLQQSEKRRQGDDTAQVMDEDFVEALEHGMPPAAGEGIGIDRLVMIATDSPSIRDVILFPQMRPEQRSP